MPEQRLGSVRCAAALLAVSVGACDTREATDASTPQHAAPSSDLVEKVAKQLSSANQGDPAPNSEEPDSEEPAGELEDIAPSPRYLEFTWPDLEDSDIGAVDPTTVLVRLRNVSTQSIAITVFAALDDAERPSRVELAELTLEAGDEHVQELDLTIAGTIDISGLKYSGSATALAHATREEDGADLGLFVSPTVFFHPDESGDTVLYGEELLRSSFRSGDYKNTHGDAFLEDGVILDRIVFGGEGEVQPIGTPIADD